MKETYLLFPSSLLDEEILKPDLKNLHITTLIYLLKGANEDREVVVNITMLGKVMGVNRAKITRILNSLQSMGYIEKIGYQQVKNTKLPIFKIKNKEEK